MTTAGSSQAFQMWKQKQPGTSNHLILETAALGRRLAASCGERAQREEVVLGTRGARGLRFIGLEEQNRVWASGNRRWSGTVMWSSRGQTGAVLRGESWGGGGMMEVVEATRLRADSNEGCGRRGAERRRRGRRFRERWLEVEGEPDRWAPPVSENQRRRDTKWTRGPEAQWRGRKQAGRRQDGTSLRDRKRTWAKMAQRQRR